MIESKIENDLKNAMLDHNQELVSALRNIKATILNKKIEIKQRTKNLDDDIVIELLAKEVKKRQESADLYLKGGNLQKSKAELYERKVIENYLPEQLSDLQLSEIINQEILNQGKDPAKLGSIINAVKLKTIGRAETSVIARITKDRLK
ncbi:MAG: GatB/YqeY domain-containing protein [Patescibacteria group bacterium]|jgi:uncharacterized protein YqeY|nr:GatB/YqeY domain-containing protein [Patescibacteria group bacterium]